MVHLIVGGAAQGKLDYARACYQVSGEQVARDSLDGLIVDCLHGYIRKLLEKGIDPVPFVTESVAGRDVVLICDEVGCGIVPVDPQEREWREAVGRTCCALARQAAYVDRVQCGIPTRIKGEEGFLKLR